MRAGELTPMERAERRVLVMANPGHGLEKMQASAAMYLGMQLLLPGEWAPSHRHTPNAVRLIVEGESAYTTVGGEKCVMPIVTAIRVASAVDLARRQKIYEAGCNRWCRHVAIWQANR